MRTAASRRSSLAFALAVVLGGAAGPLACSAPATPAAASSAKVTPSRTISLGGYDVTIDAPESGDALTIRSTPFDKYDHDRWFRAHLDGMSDPLGTRPTWNDPVVSEGALASWQATPDLTTSHTFTMDVSTASASGWNRLYLADRIVREALARFVWPDFLARNADALRALDARLTTERGAPIVFADVGRATTEKIEQFVVHDAVAALDHTMSIFFAPDASYDDVLADEAAAARIPAHLTKLVNVPSPLTDDTLVVVHAHTVFDGDQSAAAGIDREVAAYKARSLPVVYLMTDEGDADLGWYPRDRSPTYAVYSGGGEHDLPLVTDTITLAGGFFGDGTDENHGCHFRAMVDAISRHTAFGTSPTFTIRFPLDAIYYYDDDAPFFRDYLAGKQTDAELMDRVVYLFFPEEDPTYLGSEIQSEGSGQLTTTDYRFEFAIDGHEARAPIGAQGAPHVVHFDFVRPASN